MIKGFSKLSRRQKIDSLAHEIGLTNHLGNTLDAYLHPTEQKLFDEISENTLSNYFLPFGVAPNFLIDGQMFHVPMVIEESSVVAAASKGANFWASRGGFSTVVSNTVKIGQIHFEWTGTQELIQSKLPAIETELRQSAQTITQNMEKRGGGILGMKILPTGELSRNLWQLQVEFDTQDSMGANFINSCLEAMRAPFEAILNSSPLNSGGTNAQVIMCILSNYTPNCTVTCTVNCPIDDLAPLSGIYSPQEFAQRFEKAVYIATHDPYRAATHNKGIFNGIDAVALATGNDFRAIEANGHVQAASNGQYQSLTRIELTNNHFSYSLKLPLSVGTVGGLTTLHPLAKTAMEILGHPHAHTLMSIMAATGLSNNFMAVTSLVTHGIQKGHMKMHLTNILRSLNANDSQMELAKKYFADRTVSFSLVKEFLEQRNQ